MEKFPFSPDGVQAAQKELYALDNEALQREAGLIETDFRNYVSDRFDMDENQAANFRELPDEWIAVTAKAVSLGVGNRLPIILEPNPVPEAKCKKPDTDIEVSAEYDTNTHTTTIKGGVTIHL